ncbi:MAG TPA: dioxygenase [Desulfobacteraceae bacterium]|nr:dioxygenase [Desulfobacteraceae bacterium]
MTATILYIPHGGGPLPLINAPDHPGHAAMVRFLKDAGQTLPRPDAVLVISAHWERDIPVITSGPSPELIYDYYGFPEAAYTIQYPAQGAPDLASKIHNHLSDAGIKTKLDGNRGFDHGVFIPLKLMYPKADIPCVQMSLTADLDPGAHLKAGRALQPLACENILILGSGFSFHNMGAFNLSGQATKDPENQAFQDWLAKTLSDPDLSPQDREDLLLRWEYAPNARYCHPREEHLLPLHVCAAAAGFAKAKVTFKNHVIGKLAQAFCWETA